MVVVEERKAAGCKTCGSKEDLTFHHRNPNYKSFDLAGSLGNETLSRYKREMDKCDVLCRDCHELLHEREHHAMIQRDTPPPIRATNKSNNKWDRRQVKVWLNRKVWDAVNSNLDKLFES